MKKTISLLILLSLLFTFCSCTDNEEQSETVDLNKVYATVNGEEITFAETEYFKSRDKSDIINEFSQKYNITDFSEFWTTEYDGITPEQALENKAFDDAVEAKIKFSLMKEKGIYDDISYNGLKNLAEEYNATHKEKSSVGLVSIDLESFYTYYLETGEMELKNKLGEDELKPTDEKIKEIMDSNSEITEEGAISKAVNEEYDGYISSLTEKAQIEKVN